MYTSQSLEEQLKNLVFSEWEKRNQSIRMAVFENLEDFRGT